MNKQSDNKDSSKCLESKAVPVVDPEDKRRDWQRNHTIIEAAFLKVMERENRLPTNAEVAKESGLSERAISNHTKDMNLQDYVIEPLRTMSPKLLHAVLRDALRKKSSQGDKELALAVFEKIDRKMAVDLRGELKIGIQTIKVGDKEIEF